MQPFTMNNILLTRQCNLSCDYCRIANPSYDGTPYNTVVNEVPAYKWGMFAEWLAKYNPDSFTILYGGEPTVYPEFEKVLYYFNECNLPYTVITNGIKANYILGLVKEGKLRGLSASVDPVMFMSYDKDKDRTLKSSRGFQLLSKAKEINPDIDVTAEITLDKTNYQLLPDVLQALKDTGIWASVTIYEKAFSNYYDFANSIDKYILTKEDIENLKELYSHCINEFDNIHTPNALLEILNEGGIYKCDLNEVYHTSTIDSDGSIRLCLRIKGEVTPRYNIFDLIEEGYSHWEIDEIIKEAVNIDYDNLCQGCSWTCPKMPVTSTISDIQHR